MWPPQHTCGHNEMDWWPENARRAHAGRCCTPTRLDDVSGHYRDYMLTSGCGCQTYGWCAVHGTYNREPRDAAYTSRVVAEAVNIAARQGRGGGWNAACRHTQALGVWAQECALSRMPGFNWLLQVVYDSLHVLDGGVTMRIVILIGCYVFRTATEEGGGRAGIELANERLNELPRHDEFTHFDRPLYSLSEESKKARVRDVGMTVNWRCTEYEQLVVQVMYLWQEDEPWERVTTMLIAWAELYEHLRFVAPTKTSIKRAWQLYQRWERQLEFACWDEIDTVGMFVPKGHAVLHLIVQMVMWGAVDNGRLNNFEHDHIAFVKDAAKRTRGHMRTMHKELEHVVDRIDGVRMMESQERGCHCTRSRTRERCR